MRILSLDYGRKKAGLAISDEEERLAVTKGRLLGLTQNKLIEKIKAIVNLEHIGKVLVGIPFSMVGNPTEMTEEVKLFVEKLRHHLSVPVQTMDERFTTKVAQELLKDDKRKKEKEDSVAAQVLLQNYLDQLHAG